MFVFIKLRHWDFKLKVFVNILLNQYTMNKHSMIIYHLCEFHTQVLADFQFYICILLFNLYVQISKYGTIIIRKYQIIIFTFNAYYLY